MLFSSLIFLFGFLPILLVCYYLIPKKGRNLLLFVFSILFFAWGGVSYTVVLLFSVIINYLFARQLSKVVQQKKWLYIGITFNILLLVSFKHLAFIIDNVNDLSWLITDGYKPLGALKILLPLGISFFTFQQMSMLWDIAKESTPKKIKLLDTALYISFFPQLVAGPIVRYHDIIDQIKARTESITLINSGIRRFIIGLFKKIVIANTCASLADTIMANNIDDITTPLAWLGIIAYSFQIYFDFSGYSDMAIGLGRMFGFKILENFNYPYISKSIKEFWRRWHISLSTWFRDYVYFPMGGNQKGKRRLYRNLILVFLLTGIWHGATWSFVFWGIFHGLFLILERIGLGKILARLPSIISWSYAMLVVMIGWVFFRIEEFPDALEYVQKLFGFGTDGRRTVASYLDNERIFILFLAVLTCGPLFNNIKSFLMLDGDSSPLLGMGRNFILIAIFLYAVVLINSGSYNPFIYFKF